MKNYQFTLEPYKTTASRFACPNCGHAGRFTRYVDTSTREYINNRVGKCDRINNCGYHFTPKEYFQATGKSLPHRNAYHAPAHAAIKPPVQASYIPIEIVRQSMLSNCSADYVRQKNNFINFLCIVFGWEVTKKLIEKYRIGTSKYWNGATIFWQEDISGNVRTGKVMLHDKEIGKRVKDPKPLLHYAHKLLRIPDFVLSQCLFGEHLLRGNGKVVAVFESEKTAVIASVVLPQFVCVATGGAGNLKEAMYQSLRGRKVILYPDAKCFHDWQQEAVKMRQIGIKVVISEFMETATTDTDYQNGSDLADLLLRYLGNLTNTAPKPAPALPISKQPEQGAIDKVHFKIAGNELTVIEKCILENFNVVEVKPSTRTTVKFPTTFNKYIDYKTQVN